MTVPESKARAMLVAAGFATAESWNPKKLTNVLNHLDEREDELQEIEDKDERHTLKMVLKTLAEGNEVELEEEGKTKKHESNGQAKRKPTKKAEKKTPGTDKFGSRIGSDNAKINTVLSRKIKPMSQLVEEAGLKRGLYIHLGQLVQKKLVKKTPEGYALNK